jgi:O-antigen/teichoic acid export membrane protein
MKPQDTKSDLKRGLGWSAIAQFTGLLIRLCSTVIVARFLPPQVYGLLGAAMAAVTMMEWLTDLGIIPGLTRSKRGDEPDWLRTGWSLNLIRGLALAIVGVAFAWPWAALMRQPAMGPILAVLAIRPAILALRSPDSMLYRRRMNFKAIALEEVIQTLCGTITTVSVAALTGSVWALVAGTLAGALSMVISSYFLAPSRPKFTWNTEALAELRHFGTGVMLNTIAMAMSQNLDRLAGPRVVNLEQLGLYAVAANLASVAEGLLVRFCDVHFAALANQMNPGDQRLAHRRVRHHFAIAFLAGSLMATITAPWVISLLYDNRYIQAGPILGLLMIRLAVRTVTLFEFQLLLALGRLRPATMAYLVALPVQLAGLWMVSRSDAPDGFDIALCGITVALVHLTTQTILSGLANRVPTLKNANATA